MTWWHANMPVCRGEVRILSLQALLVCEPGQGQIISLTQSLRRWHFSAGLGRKSEYQPYFDKSKSLPEVQCEYLNINVLDFIVKIQPSKGFTHQSANTPLRCIGDMMVDLYLWGSTHQPANTSGDPPTNQPIHHWVVLVIWWYTCTSGDPQTNQPTHHWGALVIRW